MERNEGESFEAYKKRRKAANVVVKHLLKGRLIWDSARRGSYVRGAANTLGVNNAKLDKKSVP